MAFQYREMSRNEGTRFFRDDGEDFFLFFAMDGTASLKRTTEDAGEFSRTLFGSDEVTLDQARVMVAHLSAAEMNAAR